MPHQLNPLLSINGGQRTRLTVTSIALTIQLLKEMKSKIKTALECEKTHALYSRQKTEVQK